jgi:hypothetical protein
MKRFIASFLFILFTIAILAQEEVTFNFSRKLTGGINFTIKLYVNGLEACKLKEGESFIYKIRLDVNKPVTVLAKYGGLKQEIGFNLSPEKVCNFETNFSGSSVYLELVSGGKPLPGSGMVAGIKPDISALSILYTSTRVLPSDTIRLLWIERGGRILSESYVASLMLINLNTTDMVMTGTGGQFSYTITKLNFKVPEFKPGIHTWNSGVIGGTMGLQAYNTKITVTGLNKPMTSFIFNSLYSLNLGYTIGFGKFKGETKWKGVAFELTYRPSFMWGFSSESEKVTTSFNLGGAGLDINFNNYTSNAAKLAPRAQSKFTFFLLPPVKNGPLLINVGYGLTFYSKPYKQ